MRVQTQVKRDWYILALMLITVPLAGELKFYPVNETFRISFGAPTFFFFLLLFQRIPSVLAGFLTGMTVVCFRIVIDLIAGNHPAWEASLQAHYSSFFFYFFHVLKKGVKCAQGRKCCTKVNILHPTRQLKRFHK